MSDVRLTLPLEQLISKAAIDGSALPNSILTRQQANRFIDLVIDTSTILKRVRNVRVDHPKGEINKLDLGSIVTEGANTVSTATTNSPTESRVEYDTEKYRSAFDLKTDFVEDNIEGAGARDTILSMFSKRIAIDTEIASIEGDETLTTGDGQTALNNLLGVNDGWMKILTDETPAAQKIALAGADPSNKMFYDMKRLIPARFRVARPSYVWLVSPGTFDKWTYDAQRHHGTAAQGFSGTTDAQASAQGGNMSPFGVGPWGIPILEVPLMPESLGSGDDQTQVWLTPLDNLIYFVQRSITIEFDRRPRTDSWEVTVHFRCDFQVENADMVVMATGVGVGSGTDYTG